MKIKRHRTTERLTYAITILAPGIALLGWMMSAHPGRDACALAIVMGSVWSARGGRSVARPLAIGRRLLTGFGLGLTIFVALSAVSLWSVRQLVRTADWVRHTQEVLSKIHKVNSDLIGVQSSVRGFIISGREDFLAPYRDALRDLPEDERTLRRLTEDNPRQQARLTDLEELIRQRLAVSDQILDLYRHGDSAGAVGLISRGRGQDLMAKLWSVIAALEKEEAELLVQREARARSQVATTFLVLPVGTVIGFSLLLVVLYFLNSEALDRRKAEADGRLAFEMVKSTSDAVITTTLSGTITSWNPSAERIFGHASQEAVGRPSLILMPPESAADEAEFLSRIRRGERVDHFESVRLRKDGTRTNVSVTISPLQDNVGHITGAVKILYDITERKQAEDALKASGERFRTMVNSIPQLAWIAHADGYIYWYNERWYEYTGTDAQQMEGWGWQAVHHPEMLPKVMKNWTAAINSAKTFEMEFPLRGADGKFRNFLTRVHPLKDAEGHVVQWFGTNTDVDELKLMAESLHAAQARLHSALAAGSIGTWTWDIANDRLCGDEFTARMFSIEPEAAARGLPAEHYLRAVLEEDRAAVARDLARAIESCGRYDIEYRVPQTDGKSRWLQAKGRVEGDANGKALTFHGAIMDVTERKRTVERVRRLVDSNAQGVMFWNKNGQITEANDAFLNLVGYTRDDLENGSVSWLGMTPVEYSDLDNRSLEELAARGICTPFEKEYCRKDGSRVPVLIGAAVFEDNSEEGVCFVLDITERKLTHQALVESEGHFRFLNDLAQATRSLTDPGQIMEVTAQTLGQHLQASRCAYAEVDKDSDRFTILHDYTDGCASAVGEYKLSSFGKAAVSTIHRGETLVIRNVQAELLPEDGGDMFAAIGVAAIIRCQLVRGGVLLAMMAVHQTTPRDWTLREIAIVEDVVERCWATIERRNAEESVSKLNAELERRVIERTAQLEAANRELEAFSYSVSHDLRAPLRTVDGYSLAVLEDYGPLLPSEGARYLQMIRDGAQRMGALIDDLLRFARLNRQSLHKRLVDTNGLVQEVLAALEAERNGRDIEVRSADLPVSFGDRALLKQVWVNLLSNAVKYTGKCDKALVEIGGEKQGNEDVYFVRDNGTGFDMQYAHKLFGVFQRLHRVEDYEGTGVGLAIVHRIVLRHGGRIWAEAVLNRGATFYFTLGGEPIDEQQ